MKRYFNKSIALLLAVVSLTSCLKDDSLVLDPEKGTNVVEFGNVGSPSSAPSDPHVVYTPVTLEATPTAEFTGYINYSGPEEVAPQDITVELAVAPEVVTAYNAKVPSAKYFQLPAESYTIPTSVTIKKGQQRAEFKVQVKPNTFDAAISNVIGMQITSSSFSTVSGNFGKVIFNLPLKSIWEGTYHYYVDNNYGTKDGNIGKYDEAGIVLSTVGPNRLKVQYIAQTYSGFVEYQFNGDNTSITDIKAYNGATTYASSIQSIDLIDPVNGIFEIHWTFFGRGLVERWVKIK